MVQKRMRNVAYTGEYQEYRDKWSYIFSPEYLSETKTKELSQDLLLEVSVYEDGPEGAPYKNIRCNTAQLIDKQGDVVYSTRNIRNEAFFYNRIEHKNGNQYLIFRIDLYGYSILDLDTMQDYHYVPEESLRGGETFIWTGTFYNKNTNLLIADGCYWAAPPNIFVLGFSDPLSLPYPEIGINEYLYPESYEDIEFENWDDHDNLIIKHFDDDEGKDTVKVIEKSLLFHLLKRHG